MPDEFGPFSHDYPDCPHCGGRFAKTYKREWKSDHLVIVTCSRVRKCGKKYFVEVIYVEKDASQDQEKD